MMSVKIMVILMMSCGQVELMQKSANGDADDEESFHNDIGQSGDSHCREALQYNEDLLHEQLYSPQLLRILRSGADRLCYKAEEDEEFDVSKGMYFGT